MLIMIPNRTGSILLAVTMLFGIGATGLAATQEDVIPLVEMENVRLPDALQQMAGKARLNVILDPRLSAAPFSEMTVTIRWENVTAREALMALVDNYDLMLVETSTGSSDGSSPRRKETP